jgi:hypothetical protein
MLFEGLFVLELFLLYFLSHNVSVLFSRFFYRLTRNKNLTVNLLALLFLPGTILHEIAHWTTAKTLFVPVGKISLLPKMETGGVILGSVSMGKTDPVRRLLIGTAPVFFGVGIIVGALYFASKNNLLNNYWSILLLAYIVFEIGNTMFSSKKDMEGTIGLLLVVILLGGICYLLGLRIQVGAIVTFLSRPFVMAIFQKGGIYLLLPIVVDAIFISVLRIFHK